MQITLEQVITEARSLLPEDRARLRQWLDEQASERPRQTQAEEDKFRLALAWIRENRALYAGQWVALDGNRLISNGTSAIQVHRAAQAAGFKAPLLEHISANEKDLPFGGW